MQRVEPAAMTLTQRENLRKSRAAGDSVEATEGLQGTGGDMAEVGGTTDLVCGSCGESADRSEAFCIHCGAALAGRLETSMPALAGSGEPSWPVVSDGAETLPIAPLAAPGGPTSAAPARLRSSHLAIAALATIVLLAAGLAVAAFSWQQQRAAHHSSAVRLQAAQREMRLLRADLANTKAQLLRSQTLTQTQQGVLRRTAAVLAKVDPLLSGADELQQLTGGIESSRDSFSTDANVLVDD